MNAKAAITVLRPREEVEQLWGSSDQTPDGEVTFKDAPGDRGTEIHVELHDAGGVRARLTGADPVARLKDELRRFKQLAETGEIPRSEGAHEGKARPAQPLEHTEALV